MGDPYWDAIGRKAAAKKEYQKRHRGKLYRLAREAALVRHSPVGKTCTWCAAVILKGGMLNPESSHNSAFCDASCYGEYRSWRENRFGTREERFGSDVTEGPRRPSEVHGNDQPTQEGDPGL